jgi:hypothetical protein
MSDDPISQSGRTRARAPDSSSGRILLSPVEKIPNPAIAAAVATSVALMTRRPWTRTDVVFPSLRNDQPSELLPAGPTMSVCLVKSAGVRGVPALVRYSGEATITR